jgi:hypothetical protein
MAVYCSGTDIKQKTYRIIDGLRLSSPLVDISEMILIDPTLKKRQRNAGTLEYPSSSSAQLSSAKRIIP